uniref:Uncharacterized protein n=1 Tax=Onchocerca volvulus TaxID=6282 RepID=A0A8R1TP64_ONCVO
MLLRNVKNFDILRMLKLQIFMSCNRFKFVTFGGSQNIFDSYLTERIYKSFITLSQNSSPEVKNRTGNGCPETNIQQQYPNINEAMLQSQLMITYEKGKV